MNQSSIRLNKRFILLNYGTWHKKMPQRGTSKGDFGLCQYFVDFLSRMNEFLFDELFAAVPKPDIRQITRQGP